MGFSYGFCCGGQVDFTTATQESLQAHGGLNCCRIASGRFGPRGVTIGSNELGKLSGLLLGAIPGKFRSRGRDPTKQAACCE